MKEKKHLGQLRPGESAVITALETEGAMRRRLLDLGLVKHTSVTCLGRSPGGDPSAYEVHGMVVALREVDCRGILVEPAGVGASWA
jgi:ferrous iron transport protein A